MQLPDALYRDARRVAAEQELTLAEIVRRGLEYIVGLYPPRPASSDWQPPPARQLGRFRAEPEQWRDLANEGGR